MSGEGPFPAPAQLSSSMFSNVTLAAKISAHELGGVPKLSFQQPAGVSLHHGSVSGYSSSHCSFTPKLQNDSTHFHTIERPSVIVLILFYF